MTAPVDVLADLRGVIRIAKAASVGVTGNGPRIERAELALEAVAELIAAAERGQSLVESGAIRARQSEQDAVAEWADMLDAALAACKPATGAEK